MPDERDELLEDIERALVNSTDEDNDDCGCACNHVDGRLRELLDKARINGVIRWPRP